MLNFFVADTHGREMSAIFDKISLVDPDVVIFLGDYVDSFSEEPGMILYRLNQIIRFAKENKRVKLLLGNHDLQYLFLHNKELFDKCKCSGFNAEMALSYSIAFKDNIDLFGTHYMYKNLLATHAGISNSFFIKYMESSFEPLYHFLDSPGRFVELLNVSVHRKGNKDFGGPFWAHKKETKDDLIPNLIQVVGHTAQKSITCCFNNGGQIFYIDRKGNKTGTLILEI